MNSENHFTEFSSDPSSARLEWSKSSALRRSRPNSCTVSIPVMFSLSFEFTTACWVRVSRNASRSLPRKKLVARKRTGSTVNAIRARRQLTLSITVTNTRIRKLLVIIEISPPVMNWLIASTSLVTRVISRPTGFWSK